MSKIGCFILSLFDDERMLLRFIGILMITVTIITCTLFLMH